MNEVMTNEQMMQMMQSATMNISSLGEQMGLMKRSISDITSRVSVVEDRMQYYEDHERVNRDQARRIKAAIHGRVDYLLGIKKDGGVTAKECLSVDKGYRGKFISRCYTDARHHSNLGSPYSETHKKDYEDVIRYIDTWEPEVTYEGHSGVMAYQRYLDDRMMA